VKQTILTLLLVFSTVLVFPQSRASIRVYVTEFQSGAPAERNPIRENLKIAIRSLGLSVTENILEADYLVRCSIMGTTLRVMTLTLIDAEGKELVSADLVFSKAEDVFSRFPNILRDMLNEQPLKQSAANKAAANPGMAAADQRPGNTVSPNPDTTAAAEATAAETTTTATAVAAANQQSDVPPSNDAWKQRILFLNARIGASNRYYLSDSNPNVSIFTVDTGLEMEIHPVTVFALQFGINYALDRAEYQRLSTPIVYSTSVLSVPFMLKYIFNPGLKTTLGLYLGGYTSFAVLGITKPPPFGVLGGLEFAINPGEKRGAVFFDLRYSADIGSTAVRDDIITSYKRMFLTLSVGYKCGLGNRKR
jgi:hypothetical protein